MNKQEKGKHKPIVRLHQLHQMQIQPPRAKLPRPLMPIRTLEIRTRLLGSRRHIPAPAALIRNQRPRPICFFHAGDECRVVVDAG